MDNHNLNTIIEELTGYIEQNDYSGYGKYDALNSPLLNALSGRNKYLSLIFTQAVMRFPWNVRSLLGVTKSRNPKGIALFIRAYLTCPANSAHYRQQAEILLRWLMENHSNQDNRYAGHCYGYNFIWQSPFFRAEKYSPNQTVTTFCGEAFILAYRILKEQKYLDHSLSIARFLLTDLPVLHETDTEKCIGYIPGLVTEQVININSMAAAFLAQLFVETKDSLYRDQALKLAQFVINRRTPENFWFYTTDTAHSYIDNYHTGGIIDQLYDVMTELNMSAWKPLLLAAADNYRNQLFTADGLPRNRTNHTWPADIHGSAQGIVTFSKLASLKPEYQTFARTILDWTIQNLYSGRGYFYYQKYRFFTKKFTLMRWCNAWMFYALAEYLKVRPDKD